MTLALAILRRFWWALPIAAALIFAGVQTLRLDTAKAGLRASAAILRASRLETKAEAAKSRAWEASYRQAATLRLEEQARALRAASEDQAKCDARVAQARRSATAIQSIIQKVPSYDPNGCPLRQPVDRDSLRDALKPAG